MSQSLSLRSCLLYPSWAETGDWNQNLLFPSWSWVPVEHFVSNGRALSDNTWIKTLSWLSKTWNVLSSYMTDFWTAICLFYGRYLLSSPCPFKYSVKVRVGEIKMPFLVIYHCFDSCSNHSWKCCWEAFLGLKLLNWSSGFWSWSQVAGTLKYPKEGSWTIESWFVHLWCTAWLRLWVLQRRLSVGVAWYNAKIALLLK